MKHLLFLLVLLFPVSVSATTFTATVTQRGEEALFTLYVVATSTPLNGVEGTLTVSSPEEVRGVYVGNSVITNWIEVPRMNEGQIRFAGIVSGGFTGNAAANSGFTDPSPLFSVLYTGNPTFSVDTGAVYLHDGKGTKIPVSFEKLEPTKTIFVGSLEDRTAPEYIEVEVLEDPLLFEKQRTLVLTSHDAESGIDYFLVQEGSRGWVETDRFYVLQDSYGLDPIVIRAYDREGNFLEKKLPGERQNLLRIFMVGLLFLLCVLCAYGFRVYLRRKLQ